MSQSPSNLSDPEAHYRYRKAWAAINTLIEQGRSLSGRERNCAFLNTGGPRFADVSAAAGLDHLDDGRGVALVDWDHDGKVDLFTSNRTGPFLRMLHNQSLTGHHFVAVRLRGKTCNRDAIGARLELHLAVGAATGGVTRIHKTLRAGEGFIAQSSKWVLFGLGDSTKIERLIVRWPGSHDAPQTMENLTADRHYTITQGDAVAVEWQPPAKPTWPATAPPPTSVPPTSQARVFLATRVPLPSMAYRDMAGVEQLVPQVGAAAGGSASGGGAAAGKPMLLNLWATWCPPCVAEMKEWARAAPELAEANVTVLSLSVDGLDAQRGSAADAMEKVRQSLERLGWPHRAGLATPQVVRKVDLICRSLVDKPMQMVVPTSLLLDGTGHVAVIYRGPVSARQVIEDSKLLAADQAARLKLASHGPGQWFGEPADMGLNALVRQLVALDGPVEAAGYLAQLAAGADPATSDANRKAMLAEAHSDVAAGYRGTRQIKEVIYHLAESLRHSPGQGRVHMDLALALANTNRHAEAVPHLEAALKANPADLYVRQQLIQSLFVSGNIEQTLEHVEYFVQAKPQDAVARVFHAKALLARGRGVEAIAAYREALRLQPDWLVAMNELAWQLAANPDGKVRSGKEATELAETVVARTNRREPNALDTLAAAYAEMGQYEKAVAVIEEAIRVCRATGNKPLAARLETRLPVYAGKSAWRDPAPKPRP